MAVLDPRTAAKTPPTGEFFAEKIPYLRETHIRHGFLPNRDRLMPGDLILTAPLKPTLSSRLIARAQQKMSIYGWEWTHAAVYVGDWSIVQSNPFKGIHKALLFDYVPTHRLKVRRLKYIAAQQPAEKQEATGLRIALEASLRMPKSNYAFSAAVQIALDAFATTPPIARFNFSQSIIRHRHHICSSLYEACVLRTTGEQLRSLGHIEASLNISPAMLSNCDAMDDVDLGWAKLITPRALGI